MGKHLTELPISTARVLDEDDGSAAARHLVFLMLGCGEANGQGVLHVPPLPDALGGSLPVGDAFGAPTFGLFK